MLQKKMRWYGLLAVTSLSLMLTQAIAKVTTPPVPGFYFGLQGGYSTTGYTTQLPQGATASSVHKNGTAIRMYAGYDVNRWFGTEFGVIWVSKPNFKNVNNLGQDYQIKNNMVFWTGKLMAHAGNACTFYGDLGIGFIARGELKLPNNVTLYSSQEIVRPVYGLGFAWRFKPRWTLDTTWMQAPSRSKNNLPTTNFFGIGVNYKFRG